MHTELTLKCDNCATPFRLKDFVPKQIKIKEKSLGQLILLNDQTNFYYRTKMAAAKFAMPTWKYSKKNETFS